MTSLICIAYIYRVTAPFPHPVTVTYQQQQHISYHKQQWDYSDHQTQQRRRRSSSTRVRELTRRSNHSLTDPEAKSEEKHLKQALKDVEHAQSSEEKGAKKEHHAQSVSTTCMAAMDSSLTS
jgi:hypothetical protein